MIALGTPEGVLLVGILSRNLSQKNQSLSSPEVNYSARRSCFTDPYTGTRTRPWPL